MIYKEISGRLGNQMFQYAMARSVYERSIAGKNMVFNFQKGVIDRGFKDELKYFKVLNYESTSRKYNFTFQNILLETFLFFEKGLTLYCLLFKKEVQWRFSL